MGHCTVVVAVLGRSSSVKPSDLWRGQLSVRGVWPGLSLLVGRNRGIACVPVPGAIICGWFAVLSCNTVEPGAYLEMPLNIHRFLSFAESIVDGLCVLPSSSNIAIEPRSSLECAQVQGIDHLCEKYTQYECTHKRMLSHAYAYTHL